MVMRCTELCFWLISRPAQASIARCFGGNKWQISTTVPPGKIKQQLYWDIFADNPLLWTSHDAQFPPCYRGYSLRPTLLDRKLGNVTSLAQWELMKWIKTGKKWGELHFPSFFIWKRSTHHQMAWPPSLPYRTLWTHYFTRTIDDNPTWRS